MSSPQLQTALWVLQPVLLGVLATVMLRRKLHRDFPVFFGFAVIQIVAFAIEYPIYEMAAPRIYFCTFWAITALNMAVEFKIIHEVFADVLRPYHALKDLGTALFKWAALVMVLVSGVFIVTDSAWNDPVGRNVLILQRCVEVIQCGMVLLLLAFCKPLGVSWRRQSFGIAVGFALAAGAELISCGLFFGGHLSNDAMNVTTMAFYNIGIVVWLFSSILNRREVAATVLVPQRWDNALMDLHPHGEPESLIPMFEHMVDRAFSKTQDGHA
jgi:Tfp pilus assembly protein PilZ